jgi:hypothetical protein
MTEHDGFKNLRSGLEMGSDGRLNLWGQEMILMPRHFFRYILREVEAVAGPEAFAAIYRKAGSDGAINFCRRFLQVHNCTPPAAVEGYLAEMSLRGWGHFKVQKIDVANCYLEVSLRNSALGAEGDLPSGHVIWEGALLGAMSFIFESTGRTLTGRLDVRSEEIPSPDGAGYVCHMVVTKASGG